jgi:anti-sigma B factor antagonist
MPDEGDDGTAMSDLMFVAHPLDNGDALLPLAGELDLSHAEVVWEAALGALQAAPTRLVVDVSEVTFLTSSMLGTFLRIQAAAKDRGTGFALRRPGPLVQRILRLSGLDSLMDVEQD